MIAPRNLHAENVSRLYEGRAVVDDVSLTLETGKVTALLGQSGAGKSTLLRLFAGLERPDNGAVKLGESILSDKRTMIPTERRRIGLVFQDFALFPHLSAIQNVMFGLAHLEQGQARAIAVNWLSQVGLATRANAFPHQLSGGEQQRIAIARALAPEPVAILMDEPFSGLDPAMREDVRLTALSAIRASQTPALLVTHDASEAMLSADHLAVMRSGKITQQAAPEHVYTKPVDKETAAALGPIILVDGHVSLSLETVETPFGPIAKAGLTKAGNACIGLRPEAFLIDQTSPVKANVLSVRRRGAMVQLYIVRGDQTAQILVSGRNTPKAGDTIGFSLDPQSCSVFV